jgi:hypothetical protein
LGSTIPGGRSPGRRRRNTHPPFPFFSYLYYYTFHSFSPFGCFGLAPPEKGFSSYAICCCCSPAVVLLPEAKLLCVSIPSSSLPSSSFPSFLYLSSSSLNQDGGAYIYLAKAIHRVSAGNQQLKREREGRESRAQEL